MKLTSATVALTLLISGNAQANTVLLKQQIADPDVLVLGDYLYLTGTSGQQDSIDIWRIPIETFTTQMANGGTELASFVTHYKTYNPSQAITGLLGNTHQHRYCHIWAPDLAWHDGDLWLSFTSLLFKNTDISCLELDTGVAAGNEGLGLMATAFYTRNFGLPRPFNIEGTNIKSSEKAGDFGRDRIRIDTNIFVDQQGEPWLSYTWFTGSGNANSSVNLKNKQIIDNSLPNGLYDENIAEAPNLFYRDGYYYFVYSENDFRSKYQSYYKKATSVEALTNSRHSCRLTFNSWETRPHSNSQGYNAGHGTVFNIGADYYFAYHMGNGPSSSLNRDTYVSRLSFLPNGNIKQIPAPSFVDSGRQHIGNNPGCD